MFDHRDTEDTEKQNEDERGKTTLTNLTQRHQWIIADSRKLADEFLDAVCQWSCEAREEILVYQDKAVRSS